MQEPPAHSSVGYGAQNKAPRELALEYGGGPCAEADTALRCRKKAAKQPCRGSEPRKSRGWRRSQRRTGVCFAAACQKRKRTKHRLPAPWPTRAPLGSASRTVDPFGT